MLSVDEALQSILDAVQVLPAHYLRLSESLGCVLAEDIFADIDSPPFDNSAVDGYAVRVEDVKNASVDHPVILSEIAGVTAGSVSDVTVTAGTCVRVMTGAPIPTGADAMVMREDARAEEASSVAILSPSSFGEHVRYRGEGVRAGTRVLTAGTLIGPSELGMLAMNGAASPLCVRRPRVAALSTGDELVEPSRIPGPGQIRDSNLFTLEALVRSNGAEVHSTRHLPDDQVVTENELRHCAGLDGSEPADVILTSGGVSVGDRDFVKPALEKIGTLSLWRVNMKPGKPIAFGSIPRADGGSTLFFGLPGNPVSTMVTFELFVRPALWKMMGRRDLQRPRITATLMADVEHKPGRQEFIRATVAYSDTGWNAVPTGAQGSGILGSMLRANALIVVPTDSGDIAAGTAVTAILINQFDSYDGEVTA